MSISALRMQFDRSVDVLEARGAFSPSKHPRDKNGRFTSKLGAAARSGGRTLASVRVGARGRGGPGNVLGNLGAGVGAGWGARKGGEVGRKIARDHGMGPTGQLLGSLAASYVGSKVGGRVAGSVSDSIGKRAGLKSQGEASGTLTMYAGLAGGILGVKGMKNAARGASNIINRKLGTRRTAVGRVVRGGRAKAKPTSARTLEERLAALRRNRRGR